MENLFKDWVTRTHLETVGELGCSGRVIVLAPLVSCNSCFKPGDKSWIWGRRDFDYDKRNIYVVIMFRNG